MEYFEFYGLPARLRIDEDQLKRKFYAKSRELHPDFHTQASIDEQVEMMNLAAFNNKAYRTLLHRSSRIEYILRAQNLLGAEGENKVPQDFLMEMMELNETLMEAQMDPSTEALELAQAKIQEAKSHLEDSIQHLFDKPALADFTTDDWEVLKDHHLKIKYLFRLENNLKKTA